MLAQNDYQGSTGTEFPEIIHTNFSDCQGCYLCIRNCPVSAIRVTDGQAYVESRLCINCGTCVKICPQGAKKVISALSLIREWVRDGEKIVFSVAPSFAAAYQGWKTMRLPSALRELGASYVAETAEGAKLISDLSIDYMNEKTICTACPSVVTLIEKYYPEYLEQLIPIVSPMVAHGRLLKKKYGTDCKVVFVGPCVAKKYEALRPENKDAVDAVLTFDELTQWMEEEGIDIRNCPESTFDSIGMPEEELENARQFPIEGGMLKTCGVLSDMTDTSVISISGIKEIADVLKSEIMMTKHNVIIEPLICQGGCINGPCFTNKKGNIFSRKRAVVEYAKQKRDDTHIGKINTTIVSNAVFYDNAEIYIPEFPESEINRILAMTGKENEESQLNCGACGYPTCKEKAAAVLRGMAEPDMCLPYMRNMAKQRTDKIIETMPDAVAICDAELNMIHINPAFQKMFMCSNNVLGKPISYLISSDGFDRLMTGEEEQSESIKAKYGIKYHEKLYALRNENQYVGIYSDITNMGLTSPQVDLMKQQTLEQAKKMLFHQIRFAQQMTDYLGRNTAENEEIVQNMMELFGEDINQLRDDEI